MSFIFPINKRKRFNSILLWTIFYELGTVFTIYIMRRKSLRYVIFKAMGDSTVIHLINVCTQIGCAMVTHSNLTARAWVRLWLWVGCGMSFTLHSQCLLVFPSGFSSTLRRVQNCSVWNYLIRSTGLARTCSRWRKINGFYS